MRVVLIIYIYRTYQCIYILPIHIYTPSPPRQAPFSKRYLKYLTKKFLKKQQLRDWMRVVAVNKNTYEIKYYNIDQEDEDEEDDE